MKLPDRLNYNIDQASEQTGKLEIRLDDLALQYSQASPIESRAGFSNFNASLTDRSAKSQSGKHTLLT